MTKKQHSRAPATDRIESETECQRDEQKRFIASDQWPAQHGEHLLLRELSRTYVMSQLFFSKLTVSKPTIVLLALVTSLGINPSVMAQDTSQTPSTSAQTNQSPMNAKAPTSDHRLVRPGDRNCLRQTGTLIPPKKDDCVLSSQGRSYSGEELRNTGVNDNARALQMLDPSITRGH